MRLIVLSFALLLLQSCARAVDLSQVLPGPIRVTASGQAVTVEWPDESSRKWSAEFSIEPDKPLITAVRDDGAEFFASARPVYWAVTGKRRGGWDQFFDFPPSHPDGIRRFQSAFRPTTASARSIGERVEVRFDGLQLGIFHGSIAYTFFPGSTLILQEAIVSTAEPDTAFYYDAGLRLAARKADQRSGGNVAADVFYYDTQGRLQRQLMTGPERHPHAVRYRSLATPVEGGSLAVFPAPHQYFFARDFTSNMAYLWSRAWRSEVALGIRQLPDDNTSFYPWMNAPPGTEQRLGLFLLFKREEPAAALSQVLRFTRGDRFPAVSGFKTLAAHWHFAHTVQAMVQGFEKTPPFKPVLKDMGVDMAMIMDFHGDGHPRDLTDLRLKELDDYYRACRALSDEGFLVIPAEEANVHFGGHWAVAFPRKVFWFMDRRAGEPLAGEHPQFGRIYRAGDATDLLELVRRENGFVYQTHPRTKGSLGFPDKIRDTEHFRDAHYFGAGWKAMPSDLSTLRQGVRALNLADDMANWNMRKRLLGEVDVFQIDATHELYAHMNVNYVRLPALAAFDDYGKALDALARGDFFITTGEIVAPEFSINDTGGDNVTARARLQWTFPLAFAQIQWGDGQAVYSRVIPLDQSRPFGEERFEWKASAPGWKWARVEVWDVAGNGVLFHPIQR